MVIAALLPAAAPVVTTALGSGAITGLTTGVASLVVGSAIQPKGDRAPKITPGSLLRAALEIQALSEAGKVPRVTNDPFTGNIVISTQDQAGVLSSILADRELRNLLAPTPEESLAAQQTRESVLALVPGTIGATARQVAPGVVMRGRLSPLSGPCAAGSSTFDEIRCNLGAFA